MAEPAQLLLAYYGDDFTGSTDALEFLNRAGVKTLLFIEPPTQQQIDNYPDLQAIGVAGITRAMPPQQMEETLLPAFKALKELSPRHVHYKVCSTFDSSPAIGSIGKAIDTGVTVFGSRFTPVLVAAPVLGRYSFFGNLFARMGIGSTGEVFRLDRHPSMSKHPVTPAMESDLRVHLAQQTNKSIGLVDILAVKNGVGSTVNKLNDELQSGKEIVFFDALEERHLQTIGEVIDREAENETLFSVGSSGIEMALGAHWSEAELVQPKTNWAQAGRAKSMLVVSGSCSPVTAKQIEYAAAHDFAEVELDTNAMAVSTDLVSSAAVYVELITQLIERGIQVVLHTSKGTDDPRFEQAYQTFKQQGLSQNDIRSKTAEVYGTALGLIAKGVAEKTKLQRLIIAGGDTSGYVARAVGIEAVEMIAPLTPGAPLCKAYGQGAVNGLEVVFKGGQVGAETYFEQVLQGNI